MNVLSLYQKAQSSGLDARELAWVENEAREHPYFGLPYMISARHHLAQKTTIKDRALLMGAAYIQDRSLLHGYVQDLLQQPRAAKHESVVAPATETSASAAPAQTETPVAEVAVSETPTVENVSAEAQVEVAAVVVEAPVVEAHAEPVLAESPEAEPPVVETLVAEIPEVEAPVAETPALEIPAAETPVEVTPVVETPAAEVPAVAPTAPVEAPPVAPSPRSVNWFLNMRIKLRAQKYASLPQRIRVSASTFQASKASAVAAPVTVEAVIQPPAAEAPVQQPANEAPAQQVSAPQSSPAAPQQPADVPATQEEGYAIGAFSSFSFVETDDDGADYHVENLVMLRESVELQTPVLPEDNGEIIFEEENRVVEIVVSPELLAKYFNGHLPATLHHEQASTVETAVVEERMTLEFLPQNPVAVEPKADVRPPVTPVKRSTPSAQELIDRFIEQEPSIKRNAIPDIPAGDLARESSQERDDMVTETLAKIYAKQGNRGKAIKIYQKLGLLFPEKRDYFAARIAELK